MITSSTINVVLQTAGVNEKGLNQFQHCHDICRVRSSSKRVLLGRNTFQKVFPRLKVELSKYNLSIVYRANGIPDNSSTYAVLSSIFGSMYNLGYVYNLL